jgi:hypothetical protein
MHSHAAPRAGRATISVTAHPVLLRWPPVALYLGLALLARTFWG